MCRIGKTPKKADISYMKNTPHVPLRQNAEEKIRGKELRVVQHV
jgi:hypothetical protein